MARKKITTEEFVGEEKEEKPKDDLVDNEEKAMEEAVRDFAEGERIVKLYRYQGPLGGRPGLLGGLAREDFNDVYIQERFGGGEYFGRWKNNKGTYSRFNFKIEGEPKELPKEDRSNRLEDGEEPYPYLRGQQQQEQNSDRISMVDVLKMLAETRREAREEMRTILEMTMARQPVAQPDATDKVFSLVEKLLPMLQGVASDPGTGSTVLDGFIKLKDPLMKALETAQMALARGPAQPVPTAQPVPAQPPAGGKPLVVDRVPVTASIQPEPQPKPEPVTVSEDDVFLGPFKKYLPLLVESAQAREDPGLYCDMILAKVPAFMYRQLRTWLLTPGCLDELAKLEPIIAADPNQRMWWEALRALLVGELNEELGDASRNLQPVTDSNSSSPGPTDSA